MPALLEVSGLKTQFDTRRGTVYAVNGVSFSVKEGETLGIVGESGSGKSVTMLSVLHLIPSPPGRVTAGQALFGGRDLLQMNKSEIRKVRGAQISMVFQDPMTSLNPVLSVGYQLIEPLRAHLPLTGKEARERAIELLDLVGIPSAADRLSDFPHQFSGGMRQRVMIAMALTCNPQVLIADEPSTALDVTIQAQIVDLVKTLRDKLGMAMIWITHDLGVIAELADRVNVMYAGYIVEEAPVDLLYANPRHPYTLGLLGSLPRVDSAERQRLVSIEGMPPVLHETPRACPFAPRCRWAIERCRQENPALAPIEPEHRVACWVDTTTGQPRP